MKYNFYVDVMSNNSVLYNDDLNSLMRSYDDKSLLSVRNVFDGEKGRGVRNCSKFEIRTHFFSQDSQLLMRPGRASILREQNYAQIEKVSSELISLMFILLEKQLISIRTTIL